MHEERRIRLGLCGERTREVAIANRSGIL